MSIQIPSEHSIEFYFIIHLSFQTIPKFVCFVAQSYSSRIQSVQELELESFHPIWWRSMMLVICLRTEFWIGLVDRCFMSLNSRGSFRFDYHLIGKWDSLLFCLILRVDEGGAWERFISLFKNQFEGVNSNSSHSFYYLNVVEVNLSSSLKIQDLSNFE